jgi:cytochrome b
MSYERSFDVEYDAKVYLVKGQVLVEILFVAMILYLLFWAGGSPIWHHKIGLSVTSAVSVRKVFGTTKSSCHH